MAQRAFDCVHAARIKNNCFLKCFSYVNCVFGKYAWLNGVYANCETIRTKFSYINSCATTFDVLVFSLSVLSICHDENAWRKNAIEWKSATISPLFGCGYEVWVFALTHISSCHGNWRCRSFFSVFQFFSTGNSMYRTRNGRRNGNLEKKIKRIYFIFKWLAVYVFYRTASATQWSVKNVELICSERSQPKCFA